MRAQKNQKDAATTEPHPQENKVDFELLWRCISTILNQFGMATYMKEIRLKKYSYGYYEGTGVFSRFL